MKADIVEHKTGTLVYHRGDGARGVVIGTAYEGGGVSGYKVATGFGVWAICQACEITADYEDVKAIFED